METCAGVAQGYPALPCCKKACSKSAEAPPSAAPMSKGNVVAAAAGFVRNGHVGAHACPSVIACAPSACTPAKRTVLIAFARRPQARWSERRRCTTTLR